MREGEHLQLGENKNRTQKIDGSMMRRWGFPSDFSFQRYKQWFRDFTRGYLQGAEIDVANVQLKIDHSCRVLEFARRLTANLAPEPGLGELAHLSALFHDVGRFPQYARYRTFHDQESINHGRQGVLTLKQHQVLVEFSPTARRCILGAVILHNRGSLPQRLPPAVRFAAQVVRDSDKLDIFAVMLAHFNPAAPHNKVVNLGLRPHPDHFTPEILAKVKNRQTVDYRDMVWVNDFKLGLCSWVYDLNYGVSRSIVRERGYVEELLGLLPQTLEFCRLGRQLREDLVAAGEK